ncbi:MAG: acyl-CoA thioesterase II, partial [Deltaproteobacteria bacterium]|nr:acyl-CoA thioesterase II [Deltaproteobacteria bacterium]
MEETLADLLALLDLERIEVNLFRGLSPQTGWQRVFGGQVLGQALVAALRTVDDRPCHSLHGYFLRPGDPKVPILYDVDRIRDGKSFTTRRVVAIQHGRAIFNMAASFQRVEEGFEHQEPFPEVPQPEALASEADLRAQAAHKIPETWRDHFTRAKPIELRAVDPVDEFEPEKAEPHHSVWFRTVASMPDDP